MIPSSETRAAPLCPRAAASFHPFGAPGRVHVRFARPEDAPRLAEVLRPADRREVAALGETPHQALAQGMESSVRAYTAVDAAGRLIAVFGLGRRVAADGLRIGAPWMLGSPALEDAARPILRISRGWIDHVGRDCDLMLNWVDARNAVHIAWLRWGGFTLLRRRPFGPEGRDFIEFVRLPAPPRRAAASPSSLDPQKGDL